MIFVCVCVCLLPFISLMITNTTVSTNTEYIIAVLSLVLIVFLQQGIRRKPCNNIRLLRGAMNNHTLHSVQWNKFLPFSLPPSET